MCRRFIPSSLFGDSDAWMMVMPSYRNNPACSNAAFCRWNEGHTRCEAHTIPGNEETHQWTT